MDLVHYSVILLIQGILYIVSGYFIIKLCRIHHIYRVPEKEKVATNVTI